MTRPPLLDLLHAAVKAVGGAPRSGQVTMAQAVAKAVDRREHLLVQAGTGTGKSLAYLVPALTYGGVSPLPRQEELHPPAGAVSRRKGGEGKVVIATATLALQRQLVERDLPTAVTALRPLLRRHSEFAMLKGRSNYLCLHRLREGVPQDEEEGLFDPMETAGGPSSKLGKDLLRLRDWAEETETGDRDAMAPGVSDRAWSQVSVNSRECLGASRCSYGQECFAEAARERARLADLVVTNHALLAIDAIEGAPVLPPHQILIIDEAHELVSRFTGAATGELTPFAVNRAVKRAGKLADEKATDALQTASEGFERMMQLALPGRLDDVPEELGYVLAALRDACRRCITSLGEARDRSASDEDAVRKQALASLENIHATAERVLEDSPLDVAWYERHDRYGASLRVAPLTVSELLKEKLFEDRLVIMTSATLKLGGDFSGIAESVGLSGEFRLPDAGSSKEEVVDSSLSGGARENEVSGRELVEDGLARSGAVEGAEGENQGGADLPLWRGIDVGSPFDYPRQGILYVARHLKQPGRDGARSDMLDELTELIEAAGGRTLGLFSSMRAAQTAAEEMRGRLDAPVLLQGEETLGELIRAFASDARTCLFGTLSLWQGVDVPGSACQLVTMDRIPFPRPDDPLMSARQKEVEEDGGNGFMAVAATHAALLMAQGAGRLIRALDDRGVVAVLDPRLANARYGGFIRASLPGFWYTMDRQQVRRSLAAINASAPEPRPVAKRTLSSALPGS